MSSKALPYRALRTQPQYCKLIAANMVNRFGDSIDAIAYSLLMYRVTGSAALMALVLAINYLPTIVLQPIAGAIVDKLNKQRVMVWCDIGRGVIVAATAALHLLGALNTPLILLSVVGCSTLEALRVPAGVAIVPSLLSEELYTTGTALNQTLSRVCEVIGLSLAGAVEGLLGMAGALLIDAATFVLSALAVALIRSQSAREKDSAPLNVKGIIQSIKEGFVYIVHTRTLFALLLFGMGLNLSNVPYGVFATAYQTDFIGLSPTLMSAVQLAGTGAMALGAFLSPKVPLHNRAKALLSCGVSAVSFAILTQLPAVEDFYLRVGLLFGIMIVYNIAGAILSLVFSVTFMKFVDKAYLGRVSGATNAVLTCAAPLGALVCSALATVIPVPQMLWAGVILSAALFGLIASVKVYRQM